MLNKYCVDCKKKVSRLGTKRCQKCYGPYISKKLKGRKNTWLHKISGTKHYNWKGGRTINGDGYVLIRSKAKNRRYEYEHRVVMEKHLGRKLKKNERVHHVDGNKLNNKIKNLMLFKNHSDHIKMEHAEGKYKNQKGRTAWNKGKKFIGGQYV